MTRVMTAIGAFIALLGLIWVGQGAGYITWPEGSFMLRQTEWIYYGAATAILGAAMAAYGISRRR